MLLKDCFLKNIVEVYPEVVAMQNENGCFRDPATGYTIYKQYAGYYFAYLYTCNNSLNPHYGDHKLLERAIKGWEYYSTQITKEGFAKIITFDQFWYDSIDEWGLYYWINTIDLICEYLDNETVSRWNTCIDRAMLKIKEHIEKTRASEEYNTKLAENNVQNHYVWTLLCYYRYGMVRKMEDVIQAARQELEKIISFQSEAGTWKEAGTMVVKYSEVTFAAISLFELYDNNEIAANAIKKSLQYVLNTIYPDFSKNDCLDGRNRYSKSIVSYTALTYAKYKEGVCYLTKWINYVRENNNIGNDLQGLAVITDITRYIASYIECSDEALEKYIPQKTYYEYYGVNIDRKDEWTVSMCCLKQEVLGNRWILERQNLISVFSKQKGLIIGGGHSISQPELSCFNVISQGRLDYLHSTGSVDPEANSMSLKYGQNICNIKLLYSNDGGIEIKYWCEDLKETDRVYVNIPIMNKLNENLIVAGENIILYEQMHLKLINKNESIKFRDVNLTFNKNASFIYPILPYNSYKQEQKRVFTETFGIIRLELDYMHTSCTVKLK